MAKKPNYRVLLARLRRELTASDKREEHERVIQEGLRKRIAATIAQKRGLEIGKMYYVLPTPGQKFRGEIVAFDRHWSQGEAANHISVLVKFYNRNGAFKTAWYTTERNQFTPLGDTQS